MLLITANRDLVRNIEEVKKLKKDHEKMKKDHAQEIEKTIADLRAGATEAVLEAKIKIGEEVERGEVGSWSMAGWRATLAKLTGKPVDVSQDPTNDEGKEEGEKKEEEKKEEEEKEMA